MNVDLWMSSLTGHLSEPIDSEDTILYNSKQVVLNMGQLCSSPGDIWRCLETLLLVLKWKGAIGI